jgi:hypothetical protein
LKIEMTENEMLKVFGNIGKAETFKNPIDLNGHKFMLTNYYSYPSLSYEFVGRWVTLEMVRLVNIKSPQQIAAEEAVEKAESALEAAKDVLSKVKEK